MQDAYEKATERKPSDRLDTEQTQVQQRRVKYVVIFFSLPSSSQSLCLRYCSFAPIRPPVSDCIPIASDLKRTVQEALNVFSVACGDLKVHAGTPQAHANSRYRFSLQLPAVVVG